MEKFMEMSEETDLQPEKEKSVAAEPVTEVAEPVAELPASPKKPAARQASKRKKSKGGRSSNKSGQNQISLRQVTKLFAACGRCSYFWAGYRVLFGVEAQETAVAQGQSGWLDLEGNSQMSELLHKSYGVRLDVAHFHYEGCCKECRRRFVYQAAESEDEFNSCAIEISPHRLK
jgi:hypothetical protein